MSPDTAPERLTEAATNSFSTRAVRWIVGVGIVSLLATLVLSIGSNEEPDSPTANANAFSYSAVGHRAFVVLLERLGVDVTVSRHRSAEKAGPDKPLVVLEPIDRMAEGIAGQDRLAQLVGVVVADEASMILALPKWTVFGRDADQRWANHIELVSPYEVDRVIDVLTNDVAASELDSLEMLSVERPGNLSGRVTIAGKETPWRVSLEPAQVFEYSGALEPIVDVIADDGDDHLLVGRVRGTNVYLVSDPDILNTMGLGVSDHAALAVALVTEVLGADEVVVDEVSHGFEKAETIWQELMGFPLILVTLHLAGLLALALWAAMARFGKPEERPPRVPSGKQTLLDNTATLLALGHHAGYGAKRYFDTTLRSLARSYGIPPESSEASRVEQLAAMAARRGSKTDLRVLAKEVAALADRGGVVVEKRARALVQRIYAFRKELADGHRRDS